MPTDPTPTLLGKRYRLGRVIGEGGMGAVYEAVDETLRRRVAVKLLRDHLAEQGEQVQRFRQEAEAAARLEHPNIVHVTDFGIEPGVAVFQVMELLQGETLGAVLDREGTLAPGRAAFVGCQVLEALQAAHSAGIIHRDLKPGNVFLTSVSGIRDVVKLLDFGVAKLLEPDGAPTNKLTTTGAVMGTPMYMSPEQARGRPVDGRSDLYSLGVMLFECLSGQLPFYRENYHAILFAILEDPVPSLLKLRPELPFGLAEVVHRAMARELSERFANAQEFHDALQPFRQIETSTRLGVLSSPSVPIAHRASGPPTAPTLGPVPAAAVTASEPTATPAPWLGPQSAAPRELAPAKPQVRTGISPLRWALLALVPASLLGLGVGLNLLLDPAPRAPGRVVNVAPPPALLATPAPAPAPAPVAAPTMVTSVCGGVFSSIELEAELTQLIAQRSDAVSACCDRVGPGVFVRGHVQLDYSDAAQLTGARVLDGLSESPAEIDACLTALLQGAPLRSVNGPGAVAIELCRAAAP